MSRNKKILAFVLGCGIVLLLVVSAFGSRARNNNVPLDAGKEPEAESLSIVRFSGDAKLSSLLAAPQLNAVKTNLSTYIQANYGAKTYTATIDSTILQDDGGIALNISAGKNKTFKATIYSTDTQLTIKVPATNYQSSTPQSVILNQSSGFN